MNELLVKNETKIKDLIYEIRGKQVMLDSDLAKLYNCANGTKTINQAVNRNLNRFPSDFYFQLTKEEFQNLKSQFGTSSENNYGGVRKLPYVFTEQGVAMLASVIKTPIASEISISIMRAFVLMKKYISSSILEQRYINNLVLDHEKRLKLVENTFASFKEKNNHLFFKGQIYDAYSLLIDILNKSKTEIIIIDNYIDKKILYHCGASFKDLGKKCFEISKIEDKDILNNLLKKL